MEINGSWLRGYAPLGLLFLLGLLLRVWGLDFGLPHPEARPDELTVISNALGYGSGDFNPRFFHYPSLFSYLLFGLFAIYAVGLLVTGKVSEPYGVVLRFAEDPSAFFMIARGFSALLGALTVVLTYRVARHIGGKRCGLMAMGFMAVAYLPVRESHFAVTDTAMVAMLMAAMIWISRIAIRGSRRDYVFAGLLTGLAVSLKYNAGIAVFAILAAHCLSQSAQGKSPWQRITAARLWLAGILSIAAFLVTSPFVLIDWQTFLTDFLFEAEHLGGTGELVIERGWLRHARFGLWYGVGPWILFASALGCVGLLAKRSRAALVLCVFPFLYYVSIGGGFTVFVRYILPVVPFLCIFAAFAVDATISKLGVIASRPRFAAVVCVLVCLLMSAGSLRHAIRFNSALTRTDTRQDVVDYAIRNIPFDQRIGWIGTRFGIPHLPESVENLRKRRDRALEAGGSGRLIQARLDVAERRSQGYCVMQVDPADIAAASVTPDYVLVEYSPLPWSLRIYDGVDAILESAGYEQAAVFRGASREVLNAAETKYDLQDSFYLPYTGIPPDIRPGPEIQVWRHAVRSYDN